MYFYLSPSCINFAERQRQMGWCTLLVSAIVPTVVGSFGVLPAPCAVTTAFGGQCRHSASLTISDFRHRRNLAETVAMGWTSAARPNRHRPRIQELLSPLPAAVSNNGGKYFALTVCTLTIRVNLRKNSGGLVVYILKDRQLLNQCFSSNDPALISVLVVDMKRSCFGLGCM